MLRPAAVICNGPLLDNRTSIDPNNPNTVYPNEASEYTVVHELGHLFDYRSGNAITNDFSRSGIENYFVIRDCDNERVMGLILSNPWERGRRGWGTGPQFHTDGIVRPLITFFQQNPDNSPIEAAADMFLNWVYRLNKENGDEPADSCGLENRPLPEDWAGPGFLNQAWSATPHPSPINDGAGILGVLDTSLPGDRRYFYMDVLMRTIFSNNQW